MKILRYTNFKCSLKGALDSGYTVFAEDGAEVDIDFQEDMILMDHSRIENLKTFSLGESVMVGDDEFQLMDGSKFRIAQKILPAFNFSIFQ